MRQFHWIQDGRRWWASVSGNFRHFVLLINNPHYDNKKLWKQNNDMLIKFVWIKLIHYDILIKARSKCCICFRETGFGFIILFVYNLIFRIRILKSGFCFGLIKQGLKSICNNFRTRKIFLKVWPPRWRPFCPDRNMLDHIEPKTRQSISQSKHKQNETSMNTQLSYCGLDKVAITLQAEFISGIGTWRV